MAKPTTVGEVLRNWRGKDPIERVAVEAGVSRATVWNWETNRNQPKIGELQRLEQYRPGLLAAMAAAGAEGQGADDGEGAA